MDNEGKKETYLNAFFNSSKEIGVLIGQQMEVLLYNRAAIAFAKAHFGKEYKTGGLFIDYCSPNLRTLYLENITRAFEGTEVVKEEIAQTYSSERIFWELSFIPVRNSTGSIYAVAFTGENVTAHKLQQEKILEQYNKLKKISFRTSHIIRAPLANILGLANVIRLNGYGHPNNEYLFEMIAVSAERLDNILKDIAEEATTPGTPGAKPFFE